MKRLFLCLTILLSITSGVWAQFIFVVDNIEYEILNPEQHTVRLRTVVKHDSLLGNFSIPRWVHPNNQNYDVVCIGDAAFGGCEGLTSITIPSSVTRIEDAAFNFCSGLKTITIGDNVKDIGAEAFRDCSSLTSITIPNSVTNIGRYAFKNCSDLTSITIGSSVTSIGSGALYGCSNLCTITVDNDNSVYESRGNAIIKNDTLVIGCKNTIIPSDVTSIGEYAFGGYSHLKSITIPNNVTSIGEYAFAGCYYLSSMTIPNSVTSIGQYAFKGCSYLTSISIPNSVTDMGDGVFAECNGLTFVTIGNNVTSIGNSAFESCSSIRSITIPNNVTSIGNSAFYRCTNLNSITIGDGVTSIGNSAFRGTDLKSITIPKNVTSIGNGAFYGCTGLTSITIPNSVTSIGIWAFANCTNLTSLTLGNSVTYIGDDAFHDCTGLTGTLIIPNSVTYMGSSTFLGCDGITSLIIPGPVAGLGFQSNAITSITITTGDIRDSAFFGYDYRRFYDNLTNITLKEGVTSIGIAAFSGFRGFTGTLTIPNSVTNIGGSAFEGCTGFTGTLTIPNSVTNIGGSAFEGCTGFTGTLTIPNSVTSIGDSTFLGCTGIETIVVDANNPVYDSRENCNAIIKDDTLIVGCKNTIIPNGVTSIKDNAFYGLGLTSITIPNSVTHIGNTAFRGCKELQEITFLSTTPPNIGNSVFYNIGDNSIFRVPCGTKEVYAEVLHCDISRFREAGEPNYRIVSEKDNKGTVSVDYECMTGEAVCEAIAKTGYEFVQWSDGDTDNPRTIQVTEGLDLEAQFKKIQCTITLLCDTTQGSVSGGGTYNYGDRVSICATPDTNHIFDKWSDGSTVNPRSGYISKSFTVTALFKPKQYCISVSCDNFYGSASGSGWYDYGTSVTISVTPRIPEVHEFDQWSDGNTDNPRTIKVTGNLTFTPQFKLKRYTLTLLCDETQGSVSGSGTYDYGTYATITATPHQGYEFDQWSDGSRHISQGYCVHGDVTLTAYFKQIENPNPNPNPEETTYYTVTLSCDASQGSVIGGGTYRSDTSVTIKAIPETGYEFDHWNDGNTSNPRTIHIDGNVTLTAYFKMEDIGEVSPTADLFTYKLIYGSTPQSLAITGVVDTSKLPSDLTLPTIALYNGKKYPVTQINEWDRVFDECHRLVLVIIPEGYTGKIGYSCFYRCDNLVSITIPSTIKGIGPSAFSDCSSLTSITIPNGVTSIEHAAFWRCNKLVSATIGDDVSTIDDALGDCPALKSVTIGSGIKELGVRTFEDDYELSSLTINATTPPVLDEGVFTDMVDKIRIYVPCGTKEAYQTAPVWRDYADKIRSCGDDTDSDSDPDQGSDTDPDQGGTTYYTVTLSCDASQGSVSGGGRYVAGEYACIYATANKGYEFVIWSDGNTSSTRTLQVNSNLSLTARFKPTETPVEDVPIDEQLSYVRKVLRDGQLLIIRGGEEYSVTGCKLRIKN